jgi:hypothetical protein
MLDAPQIDEAGALKAPAGLRPYEALKPTLPPLDPSGMGAVLDAVDGAPAAPAIARGRLKGIAIVGSHPATATMAPFQDEGWLIYACSPDNTPFGDPKNCRTLPRHDQWFELHAPIEDPTRPWAYLHYVSQLPHVWMRDPRAMASGLFKGAKPYPEKELFGGHVVEERTVEVQKGVFQKQRVGIPAGDGRFCPYAFTSSIAYIMAKAIVDCESGGIAQIGLWGILQRSDKEYAYQRGGTQYFIHEALRAGIKVMVAPESRLFDMPDHKW